MVTGHASSGVLRVSDRVLIMPSAARARVAVTSQGQCQVSHYDLSPDVAQAAVKIICPV